MLKSVLLEHIKKIGDQNLAVRKAFLDEGIPELTWLEYSSGCYEN